MDRRELRNAALIVVAFCAFYFLPLGSERLAGALRESLLYVQDYARHHMLQGLVPALFIAGAIRAFVSRNVILRYLGAGARRIVAYAVASVSGSVMTTCSCTVLPFFAGVYSRGAGLGPAVTFLYAGPAINVVAILLTARVLGPRLGIARAVGAIGFSIVIGLLMHAFYRREEAERAANGFVTEDETERPVGHVIALLGTLLAVLVMINWSSQGSPLGRWLEEWRWSISAGLGAVVGLILVRWYAVRWWVVLLAAAAVAGAWAAWPSRPELVYFVGIGALAASIAWGSRDTRTWAGGTWSLASDMLPLLFVGIAVAGLALGRPGQEGLIPETWVHQVVGGNTVLSNLAASVAGGLMYFCSLTEVPIVQSLMGAGMNDGPALSFLLAGPAVSLPNVLVLRSIVGTRKAAVYLLLVILFSTVTGYIYGSLF